MFQGIVFNDYQTKAFLSIAAREGLICEKGITDGVFDRLTSNIFVSDLKASNIRENFCVAGTIYVNPAIYKCMDGLLIEQEMIKPYKEPETDLLNGIVADVDTVQMMLAEKGFDIEYYTTETIFELFEAWKEKAEEYSNYSVQQADHYDQLIFMKVLHLDPKESYDEADLEHYKELKKAVFSDPIFNVMKEYETLITVAYYNNLLSPVVLGTENKGVLINSDGIISAKEANTAISIMKYTAEKLDRIYTGSSIRECMKLVNTDESIAFREKIDELIMAISKQDVNAIEIIDKEIEKVQNAIKAKNRIPIEGKICAFVGAMTTSAGMVIPLAKPELAPLSTPLCTTISTIATFLGVPLSVSDPMKNYLWASYGIYHGR